MTITTKEQKEHLIEAGKRLAEVLEALRPKAVAGTSAKSLDVFAEEMIRSKGDEPAFLNYTPEGADFPYPATLCVSINDEVVHGIPRKDRFLQEGDIVTLDLGLRHEGIIVDAAITVVVGKTDKKSLELMRATDEALMAGIAAAQVGGRVGDIGHAIEEAYKGTGFAIVKVLGGHGVGDRVHEEPFISNFGHLGTGEELEEGMVLALEPIATLGKGGVILAPDGYTYRTKDGSRASHSEHTILLTKSGPLVVTQL